MTSATKKLTMRDRHRLMTRDHIMTSALEAFAERGYVTTTIDHIVQRAGIGRATFYLHFDSKAAVLRELRNTRMTVWTDRDHPRGGKAGRPTVRSFFEKVVDFYTSAPELYTAQIQAGRTPTQYERWLAAVLTATLLRL